MILNTDLFLNVVRGTMLAGAVYDVVFAVPIVAAPGWLAGRLGLALPAEEIYLRFIGVFLLGVALFYLLPVLHPGRYLGNVLAASALRGMGGIFMAGAVIGWGQPRPFLWLAAGDLAFAAVHLLSLAPFTGLRVWQVTGLDLAPRRAAAGGR